MSYMPDMKKLLSRPREFFDSISGENGYIKPWLTFVIASFIYYIISQILFIMINVIEHPSVGVLSIIGARQGFIFFILLILAAPFIGAGMIYLFALILGVRDTFIKTLKVVCYGGMVVLIYMLIFKLVLSFIGLMDWGVLALPRLVLIVPLILFVLVGLIHWFYIEIQGLSLYYGIGKLKAFFNVLPVLLLPILFFLHSCPYLFSTCL